MVRFQQVFNIKLEDRNTPAASTLEQIFDQVEKGELKNMSLVQFLGREDAEADVLGATVEKSTGALKIKKGCSKPRNPEEFRKRMAVLAGSVEVPPQGRTHHHRGERSPGDPTALAETGARGQMIHGSSHGERGKERKEAARARTRRAAKCMTRRQMAVRFAGSGTIQEIDVATTVVGCVSARFASGTTRCTLAMALERRTRLVAGPKAASPPERKPQGEGCPTFSIAAGHDEGHATMPCAVPLQRGHPQSIHCSVSPEVEQWHRHSISSA